MGRVGFVFQGFNLFPHMTARWRTSTPGLDARRASSRRPRRETAGLALLDKVGLGGRVRRLSVGAVGRPAAALRHRPGAGHAASRSSLFDEPTSALDPGAGRGGAGGDRRPGARGAHPGHRHPPDGLAREVASRTLFSGRGRGSGGGPRAALFSAPTTERLKQFLDRALKAARWGIRGRCRGVTARRRLGERLRLASTVSQTAETRK